MYIQPNKLMPPTSRVIRPYACSLIATEGPNILGKLDLSGVEIRYDSQLTTRITLNPGATNQPLLYGFLGNDVTFMLLKITYDETNPKRQIEEEQYITYYFEDQPNIKRHANKLLLLTGNSTNRVPQIFFDNPSQVKVVIDAMVANLDQPDIDINDVEYSSISNLYYNNVISDSIYSHSHLVNGSSQLQITTIDGYVELYLDYKDILTIKPIYNNNELQITTTSDTKIILGFLSQFDMYQSHSRISWVIKSPANRYLTKDYPGPDVEPPLFNLTDAEPISNTTFMFPTGDTILPIDIVEYFIESVYDNRDGQISLNDIYVTIRKYGSLTTLDSITEEGSYDILMYVSDIANNKYSLNYTILIDSEPPIITFKLVAKGDNFTMTEDDMSLTIIGITSDDIIRKSVDNVYDEVDGTIPNNHIIIYESDGETPLSNITVPNDYDIIYYVEDRVGNSITYEKTLTYDGYIILTQDYEYVVPEDISTLEFKLVGGVGTTSTIILSGETFTVASSGVTNEDTSLVEEIFVWDFGGDNEYVFDSDTTEYIQIFVNNRLFTITFIGKESLLFSITNDGVFLPTLNIIPNELEYSFDSGETKSFELETNLDWEIVDYNSVDWLMFNKYSGDTNTLITETISGETIKENISGVDREDIVTISSNKYDLDINKELTLIQKCVPRDIIQSGETYNFLNEYEIRQLLYSGETETSAIITISGETFTIFNTSGNTLIWDKNSEHEYEFIEINDNTSFEIDNYSYKIIFDGYDNYNPIFRIIKYE